MSQCNIHANAIAQADLQGSVKPKPSDDTRFQRPGIDLVERGQFDASLGDGGLALLWCQ